MALLLVSVAQAAADTWVGRPLTDMLEALRHSGVDVAYSTELVPPTLRIAEPPGGSTLQEMTQVALSGLDLRLHPVAPGRFVVDRQSPAKILPSEEPSTDAGSAAAATPLAPLDEVLVFAHLDAAGIDTVAPGVTSARRVPGAETDALVALRSLPGIAADTSARPYVRGSSQDDVLVIFDHVPIPDPFHLKNFGNLASVFDASVIDRVDLYSSGFPVRYGTRSGGVVELTPHRVAAGHEVVLGAGLSALRVTGAGRSEDNGVEWLAAARRSLAGTGLLSAGDRISQPVVVDALARVHWSGSGARSWTAGLLALDDSIHLVGNSGFERVNAGNRSQNLWLTNETRFNDAWQARTTLIASSARSRRSGETLRPGLISGTLDDRRDSNGFSIYHESRLADSHGALWDLGGELVLTSGSVRYRRSLQYSPATAQTLTAERLSDADVDASLRSTAYAAYASYARPLGAHFDAEFGLRYYGQRYPGLKPNVETSPRMNLRYRVRDGLAFRASVGKYTQGQKPDERRFEESQYTPDRPQVLWQESLGMDYRHGAGPQWRLDLYHKHWDRVSPYFDNLLNERGFLPELALMRVRVAPRTALAEGAEVSVRSAPERLLQYWVSYSWALVQDKVGQKTVSRSWDQRSALSSGIDITRRRFSGTAALRWHSGTPRTSISMSGDAGGADPQLLIGARNAGRSGNFASLDLRATWTYEFSGVDLQFWADVTNSLNRVDNCCSGAGAAAAGMAGIAGSGGRAAPRSVDLGVTWRFR